MKNANNKTINLIEGQYYWVVFRESEAFIAKYEGDYWMTDVVTPVGEFKKNNRVISHVEVPCECDFFKIS